VRELDAVGAEVVLVPEQMTIDEGVELSLGDCAAPDRILHRVAVAISRVRDQLVFDEPTHVLGLIGQAVDVEVADDRALCAVDELRIEAGFVDTLSLFIDPAAKQAE
jgi:hypothetical protein